ncbi:hypothetical protein PWG71_13995 [Nocardiopsis sp. N85]|uniref:hypothetical protein n=1 Tax=Nocardiopsis sp. N85 TaxID=3029400 RepID=UPI00237F7912|nr:hypothetical protein [Nocardiopsis sp. N85]MDE3722502.1 hypothetical protein [Nocardiopsis sp. N85]
MSASGSADQRRRPFEPEYVGGLGTRWRGWISLAVYTLCWIVLALLLTVGLFTGGLDMTFVGLSGFVGLCLLLGPVLLWAIVKPLSALGRGLSEWGGHRVLWAVLLGVIPVAALAGVLWSARDANAGLGAAVIGAVTFLPMLTAYAALRPEGEVRRSRSGRLLWAILLAATGLGDVPAGGGPRPTHRRADLDEHGEYRGSRADHDASWPHRRG